MKGSKGLFVPGPTNVPERVRKAIDIPMEDHRAPDLPEFILPLLADLRKIFKSNDGQIFLFPGSGTGGWEAAITNTLKPGDKVLASRFGQFSHLWIDLCERHGLDVEIVDVEWGEGIPVDTFRSILSADTKGEIKAVLATQNETATGVQSSISEVREAIDSAAHPAMLFVDGVSSIGSIDFQMDEWGVDIAVSGSQKGFMLPAGLAIMCVSQKALKAHQHSGLPRCYFDFSDMSKANATGYFPYTPPMSLIRGLRVSVDMLLEEGLETVFARHHHHAEGVRRAVAAWGLQLCAKEQKWQSDTVSAICVPEGHDANKLIQHAYQRYGLSLGAGLSVVAGKVFRIGHLGDLNEMMIMSALSIVEMTMRDVGLDIVAGSGVAAAGEYYRSHDYRAQFVSTKQIKPRELAIA
ncbi:MAG: aminotransferase class V-fold PLP-dependent enzyme [Granulosicoccus sp.]